VAVFVDGVERAGYAGDLHICGEGACHTDPDPRLVQSS